MPGQVSIVVIDDNASALKLLAAALERDGLNVYTALHPEEGMAIVREHRPSLVVTDLVMPGMSGNDLVAHIKQISPATPVILFSGQVKMYDQNTLADIFLPKGMYSVAELLERIRLLLVHKRGPKRAVVPVRLPRASGS